jgi:cyclic beta-1,2-glucan synthetase
MSNVALLRDAGHARLNPTEDALPIRGELFGLDHLEEHARTLATALGPVGTVSGRPLLSVFHSNARRLQKAHRAIMEAVRDGEPMSGDAEWLLDNFYIIADALAEIRVDLPRGYYKTLPKLQTGPLAGLPRIYALALEMTAHCDSGFDENNLSRFVHGFQSAAPLNVGELWAIPIMLRLCLVENLRRLAEHIVEGVRHRRRARNWVAVHAKEVVQQLSAGIPADRFEFESIGEPWRDCYKFHLLECLREASADADAGIERFEECLKSSGCAADVFEREKRRQAANQVSIGNCVTSLRLLSAFNWPRFFERSSHLEKLLREDPAGSYSVQDFATRDRCRQTIEALARGSHRGELEVGQVVLQRTRTATGAGAIGAGAIARHIAYHLLGDGRSALEAELRYRPPLGTWLTRAWLVHPHAWYFGCLFLLCGGGWAAFAAAALVLSESTPLAWIAAALAFLPISEIAVAALNALAPRIVPPRTLPRLDFPSGVPADCATMVVIPTILSGPGNAPALIERLEIHYLANPEDNLFFALLTDVADAATEVVDTDQSFVQAALEGIRSLNERYAAGAPKRFFLFHRGRRFNASQNCWMGWERKRGKLAEFNRYLRTGHCESAVIVSSPLPHEPRVRFIITLDTDTQLPREAARRLIATLAHPLNQPRFDADRGRVVAGYGVLQPRIELSLRGARQSPFARIFGGSAGLDPYTTAVSDTYQDLFGQGSFTGKGIYELDAFEAATGNVFPDNHILSHDLIEGNYARCGLMTDGELLDDFPSHYQAYARREHRWVRGDWQILPWLARRPPSPDGKSRPNPLPLLERWKILDNLRRSVTPPSLVAMLVVGWFGGPGLGYLAAGVALAMLFWPLITALSALPMNLILGRRPAVSIAATAGRAVLSAIFLADQACSMVDAVARTLVRMYITRRHLLEWESAAAAERRLRNTFRQYCRAMIGSSAIAVATATGLAFFRAESLSAAAPWLVAWLCAPAAAWLVSQPSRRRRHVLTPAETSQVRRLARKTWGFFETFVTAQDHWLPPDNFQEDPKAEVAHRTSPTNIGLYLTASVAAHEFGYITWPALLGRLERTLDTLDRLERHRGHFLNWYETTTLEPLNPKYISTVDSGNLAASLLAAKQGLLQMARTPVLGGGAIHGIEDTIHLLHEALHAWCGDPQAFRDMQTHAQHIDEAMKQAPKTIRAWASQLRNLDQHASALKAAIEAIETPSPALADVRYWSFRLSELLRERIEEANLIDENSTGEHDFASFALPAFDRDRADDSISRSALETLVTRIGVLAERLQTLASAADFTFLYNGERNLFAVGENLTLGRLDGAHYDLLASEAALTSYLAIARGEVPKKHWFQLGRPTGRVAGHSCLLSWGGTMFEYLMPRLFLRAWPDTLLEASQRSAVLGQIAYGRTCGAPWGVSESAFSVMDGHMTYQYQAFGVPGLGLKRGLGKDLVVAPYATGLAVMTDPRRALRNLRRLRGERGEGTWGMFEAIDFTAERLPADRHAVVVRCYMAHHQAMLFLGLANGYFDDLVPRWFHSEPMVRATELLLQERVPRETTVTEPQAAETSYLPTDRDAPLSLNRRLTSPHTAQPRTHMLSSGRYSLMVSNAGGGRSTCDGLAVTRWRQDALGELYGQFIYLRDLRTGERWSAAYLPLGAEPDEYEVLFGLDKVEFRRVDGTWETRMEITVSPETHAEVRRLTLTNHDRKSHFIEATSYAEIALAPQAADVAHPAFSKLFVETEYLPAAEAIVCRRRPRAAEQKPIWALHVMATEGRKFGVAQYETDRAKFIGRGRTVANPIALEESGLSGTAGPVLDPVACLRRPFRVKAGASIVIAFTTALADSREAAEALADQYHDFHGVQRAFELAWAHSQVELRQFKMTAVDAHLYQRLASYLIYPSAAGRAGGSVLSANRLGQSGLWRMGISGDWPITLARIADSDDLPLVRQLLTAHDFWRRRGLLSDLVLLNERADGYFDEIHEQLLGAVRAGESRDLLDKPGGIFLRKSSQLSGEERTLLQAAALLVLRGNRGSLTAQLEAIEKALPLGARPQRQKSTSIVRPSKPLPAQRLAFDNGIGGFTAEGREYRMRVTGNRLPPQPWINVIANPKFGFLISESGSGFTWAGNSQSNRLTPWHNDPVSDPATEVLYLRDEHHGDLWSATPQPLGGAADYLVSHGQGYSTFELQRGDLHQNLAVFAPPDEPVKIYLLRIQNQGQKPRRLVVSFFAEWVIGTTRDRTMPYLSTREDPDTGALLATNVFHPDEPAQVAFADISLRPRAFTGDRREFVGRHGSVHRPAASGDDRLSGKVGPGLDACAGLAGGIVVPARQSIDVVVVLGAAPTAEEARRLIRQYREPAAANAAFDAARKFWDRILSAVVVETPDAGLNFLMNRWLPYQVLSCRIWGRSAFYQSGGAYGFRDQLQDSMALVYSTPQETREHLLRAAARQFVEGDVQHWWHPPRGAGVRTRFSDDYLWLPFTVHHYITATGDVGVLDETVPYLHAPVLLPGQEEDYRESEIADESGTLYEHCLRAIDNGLRFGAHGLPLMGTGDWNDGMNRVGAEGRGESVWTGWFLLVILRRFASLCSKRGDRERADALREEADRLASDLEANAWDGAWYRRAFFDDGSPLGSSVNDACQIDSLAQTWAVIAGADGARSWQAMVAVDRYLVRRDDRLVLLFTPPFDKTELNPGYIKGYLPGVRENGGQYTHAAIWVAKAWARLGDGDRAYEIIDLLNPIGHAASAAGAARFRLEPYVIPADVYSQPPHVGRGGWSWYTGSASWYYRVVLEDLLGLEMLGDRFRLKPALPLAWPGVTLTIRRGRSSWRIEVRRAEDKADMAPTVDGKVWREETFPLVDDHAEHRIVIYVAMHQEAKADKWTMPGVNRSPEPSRVAAQ